MWKVLCVNQLNKKLVGKLHLSNDDLWSVTYARFESHFSKIYFLFVFCFRIRTKFCRSTDVIVGDDFILSTGSVQFLWSIIHEASTHEDVLELMNNHLSINSWFMSSGWINDKCGVSFWCVLDKVVYLSAVQFPRFTKSVSTGHERTLFISIH